MLETLALDLKHSGTPAENITFLEHFVDSQGYRQFNLY